jgi:methyl-accepting chemotaxis protein
MADQNLRVNITAFDKTQRAFASVRAGLGKVKSSVFNVRNAVVGLGATLVLKQFAGQIDDLAKASGRLGLTVNELQSLQFAAGQTGVSSDELNKSLERFSRSIGETAQGIGSAKEEFEQLGISVKNADGSLKPTTTLLNEVSDGLKDVSDPAERVRIAFDLFGRSGAKLINTLKGGSESLTELRDRFNDITIALTEDQAKAVEAANDGFDRLGKTFVSFGQSITATVLPGIQHVAEAFTVLGSLAIANIIDGVGVLRNKFIDLAQTFGFMAEAEKSAINEGTSARLREIAESYALASGQVSNLADNVKKVGEEAAPAEDALAKLAKTAETTGEKSAKTVASSFGDTFKAISLGTKSASDAFSDMAKNIISRLFDILVVEQLVQSISGAFTSKGGTGAPATPKKGLAIGGSVQRGVPTIVGERGAELFLPASSGSIVPNNKMGGNGGTTVVQNINISTGVSQTVRAEIAQLMPQIANSAKAAVLDAKQRGGSFSKAF